jgi:hypothetical protein
VWSVPQRACVQGDQQQGRNGEDPRTSARTYRVRSQSCRLPFVHVQIAKPRQATAFSAYVKAHFAQVRDELASDRESWEAAPGTKEVMRALAERYKADKSSAGVGGALESVSQGEVQDLTESPAGSVHDSSQAELEVWSDAEEGEDALDALQSAMIDLTV